MANFPSIASAIAMVTAILLLGGGLKLALSRQTRVRGTLMIAAALVLVMNVMIWTV
jgi:high-affinity Fe2+/Pb2+ permease